MSAIKMFGDVFFDSTRLSAIVQDSQAFWNVGARRLLFWVVCFELGGGDGVAPLADCMRCARRAEPWGGGD